MTAIVILFITWGIDVSCVAPIDKLNVVITICLSFLFLKEPVSPKVILGALPVTCGSILMLTK